MLILPEHGMQEVRAIAVAQARKGDEAGSIGKRRAKSQDGLRRLAGSTFTSAGAVFFAIFVQTISAPAASRFPLWSVTSVCAGLLGGCAWFATALAFTGSPNAEAVAAPIPSPAYFKILAVMSRSAPGLSLIYSRGLQQTRFAAWDSILQNSFILGTPLTPGKFTRHRRA